MNTLITDWFIVSIMDKDQLIGDVIWGIVEEDNSYRFSKGDYVSTSRVVEINYASRFAKTSSGSLYQLQGNGKKAIIDIDDLELLRSGFSPIQIRALNKVGSRFPH